MEADRTQRLILWNQYEILKRLDPDHRESYEERQAILEYGFETAFEWMMTFVGETISKETCNEVIEILVMFDAIERAQSTGAVTTSDAWAQFHGFDGNNETDHMAFANFLFDKQKKFSNLAKARNSHMQVLRKYRAMLAEWNLRSEKYQLSQADVDAIVAAT